ncbi:MAG TPA: PqqD family protein [Candidatus Dormibacteraeota bacterium]|nr:PqqD family protein [Candidatus Dormibacteraeota bacterium]
MTDGARVPKWSLHATVRNRGGRLEVLAGPDGWDLSEVGGFIWRLCDGRHSVDAIAEAMVREYEVAGETARHDVTEFLADLEASGLIAWVAERRLADAP